MAWQVVAAMAAAQIVKGISDSGVARGNAAAARSTAEANARAYQAAGEYNADLYLQAGDANARNVMAAARWNADVAEEFADYNAGIIEMVSDYNAQLNELEARYALDAAEIEIDQTDKQIRQILGKNRVYYAGAGVQPNTGSPIDAEIDVRTQGDIDLAIIRRGAEIEAGKFLDAAAMTRWQGGTDATLTRYRGQIQGYQALAQGSLQAATIRNDAGNQAAMTRYNSNVNAIMTRFNGYQQASLYDTQAKQSMFGGFLNAGMTAAGAYMNYQWMSPKTPAPTSSYGPLRSAAVQGYNRAASYTTPSSLLIDRAKSYSGTSQYSLLTGR